MVKEKITVKRGVKYLSEVMDELPKNCLFDKGKVGCGGTTIALKDDENTVIVVPFISLINSKVSQIENVLGVYGDVDNETIENYLSNESILVKKIMVTYDSIERLLDFINPSDYNLLVDEYHLLFTQYSFRRAAVIRVLNNYKKFKSYTFMTATPLEDEFILSELRELPIVKCDWEENNPVKVLNVKCDYTVEGAVFDIIKDFLSGKHTGNAYFFVNSLDFIEKMINSCKLTEDNCRVIYSQNNVTKLPIKNSSVNSEPKKINFLTSTVFEGADIYDEKGNIIIVSDGKKAQTLTDISTSFRQIAGRIRNSRYADTIMHIYSKTRYSADISYDDYRKECLTKVEEAKRLVDTLNSIEEFAREAIAENGINKDYVVKTPDNTFYFDENRVKVDLYNFKVVKGLYKFKINVYNELKNNNFEVNEYTTQLRFIPDDEGIRKNSFEKLVRLVQETGGCISEYFVPVSKKYDFFRKAWDELGYEEMERLKFKVSNIKRALMQQNGTNLYPEVLKYLKTYSAFEKGKFISAKEAKELIREAYERAGIQRTPNIKDYFEVKDTSKRIDGEKVRGYIIILEKAVIK